MLLLLLSLVAEEDDGVEEGLRALDLGSCLAGVELLLEVEEVEGIEELTEELWEEVDRDER